VFENKLLGEVIGPEKNEAAKGFRIIHKEEFCNYTLT
jgi:hypothetical protein